MDPRYRTVDQASLLGAVERLKSLKPISRFFNDAEITAARGHGEAINGSLDQRLNSRSEQPPTPEAREKLRRNANAFGLALVVIGRERGLRPAHYESACRELGEILGGLTVSEFEQRRAKGLVAVEADNERIRALDAKRDDPEARLRKIFKSARDIMPRTAEDQGRCDAFEMKIASFLPGVMTRCEYPSPGREALARLKKVIREASGFALTPDDGNDDLYAEAFAEIAVRGLLGSPPNGAPFFEPEVST